MIQLAIAVQERAEEMMNGQTLTEESITSHMAKVRKEDCLTVDQATEETGVTRQTLYTYLNVLNIQRFRFPRDRHTYILKEDVERIKELLEENR
jgi:predicted DNA-binding transcriptional regulator AlpA